MILGHHMYANGGEKKVTTAAVTLSDAVLIAEVFGGYMEVDGSTETLRRLEDADGNLLLIWEDGEDEKNHHT